MVYKNEQNEVLSNYIHKVAFSSSSNSYTQTEIARAKRVKYLGLNLDSKLMCKKHTKEKGKLLEKLKKGTGCSGGNYSK